MKSNKKPQLLTPRGVAIYPHLNTPDTKWKAEGEFKTRLAFDGDDAEVLAFMGQLYDLRDAKFNEITSALIADKKVARAKEIKKADVLRAELDESTGEETGRLIATVSMRHKVTSRKDGQVYLLKPLYYNAKRVELLNPPRIGGGSLLRCFVEPDAYMNESNKTVGVSLRLKAIQIIKLVSGGQRSAEAFGFANEDGDDIEDMPVVTSQTVSPVDMDHDDL
jgi:hypothetical protein